MNPIKLSLTQFLTYKAKVSTSAKINYLKTQVKYHDYTFYGDYWLSLRHRINDFSQGKMTKEELINFAKGVSNDKNKQKNYLKDTRNFLHFVEQTQPSFFKVQKSYWNYKDLLIVSASPELGIKTSAGRRYLLKNLYTVKKDDEKIMKRTILPTLTMMHIANQGLNYGEAVPAVLNLRNGKLIEFDASKAPAISDIELRVDAKQIIDIWQEI